MPQEGVSTRDPQFPTQERGESRCRPWKCSTLLPSACGDSGEFWPRGTWERSRDADCPAELRVHRGARRADSFLHRLQHVHAHLPSIS